MLLTPADPFSQSMLAIPMWMLFEAGVLAGNIIYKKDKEGMEKWRRWRNQEESNFLIKSYRPIIYQTNLHIRTKLATFYLIIFLLSLVDKILI